MSYKFITITTVLKAALLIADKYKRENVMVNPP